MRVVIIADDLTGALDSAVAFAVRGMRTVCARTVRDLAAALDLGADVVSVSTGSRELAVAEAVASVTSVRTALLEHRQARDAIWFKKVDSRLKGHVAAEVAALTSSGQGLVVCPAIPRLGRQVVAGSVVGSGIDHPIPISDLFGGFRHQIIDAKADRDIDIGLANAPDGALLVGAAGLAEALARRLRPGVRPATAPRLVAPALIAIGSRDPVTLAQIDRLDAVPAPNGAVPAPVSDHDLYTLVQLTPGPCEVSPRTASDRFADGIAAWIEARVPSTLIASGGETASAIMQRLGIGLLDVLGEALPGLPVSRALDGRPGLAVVTKSGGFGGADTLVNLVGKLVKSG